MARIPALVALALLAPLPANAESSNPPPFVAVDFTVRGGEHVWTEPVVVGPGATLTVEDATVWLDWEAPVCTRGTTGYCHPEVMVLPGGTFRAVNSTLDSHGWSVTSPYSGFTIHAIGGALDLRDSTIRRFESIGAQGGGPNASTIVGNRFSWGIAGISLIRNSTGLIANNRFEDVMYSIAVRDTYAVVRDNHIIRGQRHFATEPFGRGIDVQSTIVGEKFARTEPLVEGNVIEDGSLGILHLNGFAGTVRGNIIRNNRIGGAIGLASGEATLHHETPDWTGNRFEHNVEALQVYVSGKPETEPEHFVVTLRGNSFLETSCTAISQLPTASGVTLEVNATGNWWGTAAGPQPGPAGCPITTGDVDIEPWLTEPPA